MCKLRYKLLSPVRLLLPLSVVYVCCSLVHTGVDELLCISRVLFFRGVFLFYQFPEHCGTTSCTTYLFGGFGDSTWRWRVRSFISKPV